MKKEKATSRLIQRGHQRIQEKIKEIRQSFSKAVIAGTRSGSGKIVYEHYDELVMIWGGSPATEPLSFGVGTETILSQSLERQSSADSGLGMQANSSSTSDENDEDVILVRKPPG